MIGQTHKGLAPTMKTRRRRSVLVPSLWVINALLVGVVIMAPASRQASTSPVDEMSNAGSIGVACDSQSCLKPLLSYLGEFGTNMREAPEIVAAAPPDVSAIHALRSDSRVAAIVEGDTLGGALELRMSEGSYHVHWVDPITRRTVSDVVEPVDGLLKLTCPAFSGNMILDIKRKE